MILKVSSASGIKCWKMGVPLSSTRFHASYYHGQSRIDMTARCWSELFSLGLAPFCRLFSGRRESSVFDITIYRSKSWSSRI